MDIFKPAWLHIKIYIAKTRACATQVKLDSVGNGGTVSFIIFVGTCAYPKSVCATDSRVPWLLLLLRRLREQCQFYSYLLCRTLIVFHPAGAYFTPIGIGASTPLNSDFNSFLRGIQLDHEQSSNRSQHTHVASFLGGEDLLNLDK